MLSDPKREGEIMTSQGIMEREAQLGAILNGNMESPLPRGGILGRFSDTLHTKMWPVLWVLPFLHVPWKSQFSHVSGRCEAEAVRGSSGLGARVWRRRQDLLLAPCQRGAARPTDRTLRRPQVCRLTGSQRLSINV